MKQEYLFVDNKYKSEIEQYTHKTVVKEILNIDDSDCWIATFSLKGENENTADVLSEVNEYIVEHFSPTVLSSGCSAYYNRALYPLFNEFERKLRKLLYLKTALSKSEKDIDTIKDIEKLDFGQIFAVLFTDDQFITDVKKTVNGKTWKFTKNEVLDALQKIPEQSFWDNSIGADVVPLLKSDFTRVRSIRNDVMHAHNINVFSFRSARNLIKEINEQLDTAIQHIIKVNKIPANKPIQRDFTDALNKAIGNLESIYASSTLNDLLLNRIIGNIDTKTFVSNLEDMQQFIQTQQNMRLASLLMPSPDELKTIQKNVEFLKNSLSKGQMDVETTKPSEQNTKSEEGKTNGQDENGNVEHDGSEHK